MKITIKKSLQGLLLVPALMLGVGAMVTMVQPSAVLAQDFKNMDDPVTAGQAATGQNDGKAVDADSLVKTIINVLLYTVGAVSIIMIIVGGFKYVTSGGDSTGVTSAKNTILYSVIGLV